MDFASGFCFHKKIYFGLLPSGPALGGSGFGKVQHRLGPALSRSGFGLVRLPAGLTLSRSGFGRVWLQADPGSGGETSSMSNKNLDIGKNKPTVLYQFKKMI